MILDLSAIPDPDARERVVKAYRREVARHRLPDAYAAEVQRYRQPVAYDRLAERFGVTTRFVRRVLRRG